MSRTRLGLFVFLTLAVLGLGWLANASRARSNPGLIILTSADAATDARTRVAAANRRRAPIRLAAAESTAGGKIQKIIKSNEEWKKLLPPATYYVMREEGTERPFSGDYKNKSKGTWNCAACDLPLFSSETKFESGTGWPSFWKPIAGHVEERGDADGHRVEVRCMRCEGHLGHVFDDGPKPTGLRYCINAVALKLDPH